MIRGEVEVVVRDKSGVEISHLKQPMRSWVANFARVLAGLLSAAGVGGTGAKASATVLDQTGATVSVWTEWYASSSNTTTGDTPMACNAGDDVDAFGIVVGKGTTPVSYDDYSLANKIPHGTGAGQLDYGPTNITAVSVADGSARFMISRTFTNVSGDSITVAEVGIIARSYWADSGGVRQDIKYLIARDVLDEPQTVPNLATLSVNYTFEVIL